jgi:hypothetical protein
MAAAAGATGVRSWLQTRSWRWMTPQLLHRATLAIFLCALLLSSITLSGST